MSGGAAYLLLGVVAAVLIVATPVVVFVRDKRRRAAVDAAFLARYGSLDGARATLDLDVLRALRDREGVIPAVRLVRREHPDIPLPRAAEIVRTL